MGPGLLFPTPKIVIVSTVCEPNSLCFIATRDPAAWLQISLSTPEPNLPKRVNLSGMACSPKSCSTVNMSETCLYNSSGRNTILSASSTCEILESGSISLLLYSETLNTKRHAHPTIWSIQLSSRNLLSNGTGDDFGVLKCYLSVTDETY